MKKKRLIGLLLTAVLLIVAMICQVVGAESDEQDLNPGLAVANLNDYYVKTAKTKMTTNIFGTDQYTEEELSFNYSFFGDGTIGGKQTHTSKSNSKASTSYSSFKIKKEFDDQNRLVRFECAGSGKESYSLDYSNEGFYNIIPDSVDFNSPSLTFDPEHNTYYVGIYAIEYDSQGHKTKMTNMDTEGNIYKTTNIKNYYDSSNNLIKKEYRSVDYNGKILSGTVYVEYTLDGSIHHETVNIDDTTRTYDYYFNNKGSLIKKVIKETKGSTVTDSTLLFSYDKHGNLTSMSQNTTEGSTYIDIRTDYTYEYHSLYEKNAEAEPSIIDYWEQYNSQSAVNKGGDIQVEMTDPDPSTIKSAGIQTYDDGTEYYFNEIMKPLDASEEQVFTLNLAGSAVDSVDEENPSPAYSFNIYDSNVFSEDHLVANIENGKMENACAVSLEEDTVVEPANAGGSGTLMMALPLQVKAPEASGYNVSVTIPANTLEEGKTYYFVLDKKMVVNEAFSATTNTDFVYKFKTVGEDVEHVHSKAKPVKENEVASTCTKEGSYEKVVYCYECGEELSRETKTIDKLAHTEEAVPGKAAKCTEAGLTDGKKCSVCGEVLEAQKEIPALGHKEVAIPGKAATCTEVGLTEGKKCSVCGEVLEAQKEIPAIGHKYENGVCTRCGAKDPTIPDASADDLDPSVNGIVKCPDGVKWAMYKNGKVDTSYTGVANNKYGWWRVENGYVNFKANGIYQNKYGWWKTTNGKVTFKEFGLFEYEGVTYRVECSKVNFNANSIYKGQDGNWYKTTNGKVTFKETGVFQNQYGWWYVKDSKVDFNYTGVASNKYGKWYINKGKVDFTKVGFVKADGKTYTVMFGKVIFG